MCTLITTMLKTMRTLITAACPSYFQSFDSEVAAEKDTYELEHEDDVDYLQRLIKYLESHEIEFASHRGGLRDEQKISLAAAEVQTCNDLEVMMPDLMNMQ